MICSFVRISPLIEGFHTLNTAGSSGEKKKRSPEIFVRGKLGNNSRRSHTVSTIPAKPEEEKRGVAMI